MKYPCFIIYIIALPFSKYLQMEQKNVTFVVITSQQEEHACLSYRLVQF